MIIFISGGAKNGKSSLAQELALRDMDDPPITAENYDEVMERMNVYLGEFERHGTDNISVDME